MSIKPFDYEKGTVGDSPTGKDKPETSSNIKLFDYGAETAPTETPTPEAQPLTALTNATKAGKIKKILGAIGIGGASAGGGALAFTGSAVKAVDYTKDVATGTIQNIIEDQFNLVTGGGEGRIQSAQNLAIDYQNIASKIGAGAVKLIGDGTSLLFSALGTAGLKIKDSVTGKGGKWGSFIKDTADNYELFNENNPVTMAGKTLADQNDKIYKELRKGENHVLTQLADVDFLQKNAKNFSDWTNEKNNDLNMWLYETGKKNGLSDDLIENSSFTGQAVGQIAPLIIGSILTDGALRYAPIEAGVRSKVVTAVMTGVENSMNTQQVYEDNINSGADIQTAFERASNFSYSNFLKGYAINRFSGIFNRGDDAITQALDKTKKITILQKGKNFGLKVLKYAKTAGGEGLEELTDQLQQNQAVEGRDISEGVSDSFWQGVIGGSFAPAIHKIGDLFSSKEGRDKLAENKEEVLKRVTDAVQDEDKARDITTKLLVGEELTTEEKIDLTNGFLADPTVEIVQTPVEGSDTFNEIADDIKKLVDQGESIVDIKNHLTANTPFTDAQKDEIIAKTIAGQSQDTSIDTPETAIAKLPDEIAKEITADQAEEAVKAFEPRREEYTALQQEAGTLDTTSEKYAEVINKIVDLEDAIIKQAQTAQAPVVTPKQTTQVVAKNPKVIAQTMAQAGKSITDIAQELIYKHKVAQKTAQSIAQSAVFQENKKAGKNKDEKATETKKEAQPEDKKTQKEKVEEAIKESPKTIKEIAEETKILEPNVRRILGVGAKEGVFTRKDKGVYILSKDGVDTAYVHTGDAVETLPRLAEEGLKADMVFLDIPYDTPAVKGGNRGVKYDLISVADFGKILDATKKILKDVNAPIIHMYSQAESGLKKMTQYNDLILEKGFLPVGRGEYQKTFADGSPVTSPNGKVSKPEGILVFTQSGKLKKDLTDLNFTLKRPKGYQTEKPAEMLKAMIEMTTEEGDTVLDPFAGSGVTGAEAVRAGRKAVLIEKDAKVADEITKPRVEKALEETPSKEKPVIKENLITEVKTNKVGVRLTNRTFGKEVMAGTFEGKPYATNTFMLEFNVDMPHTDKLREKAPDEQAIKQILDRAQRDEKPITLDSSGEYETKWADVSLAMFKDTHGDRIAVNQNYYDYFTTKYNDVSFGQADNIRHMPIVVRSGDTIVGLLMPMNGDVIKKTKVKTEEPTQEEKYKERKAIIEKTRDLVNVHNLSERNILFSDKFGGIVNPSIATVDISKQGLDNFGEITLVGKKDFIDKGNTYRADVYSPRFPSILYPATYNQIDAIKKDLKEINDKIDGDEIYLDDTDIKERLLNTPAFIKKFIDETGIKLKMEKTSENEFEAKTILNSFRAMRNSQLEFAFENYADEYLKSKGVSPKLYNGYTYSGRRRYLDANQENVLKMMNKKDRAGENFNYGLGSLRAKITPKLSTNQIEKNKNKIVTTEEFEKARKEMDDRYFAIAEEFQAIAKHKQNIFDVESGLNDFIGTNWRGFLDNYENVPQSLLEKVADFKKDLVEMPTEYFETKIKGLVDIGEFKYAVVPDTVSKKVLEILDKKGVEVVKYDHKDKTDRASKIAGIDEARFKSKETAQPQLTDNGQFLEDFKKRMKVSFDTYIAETILARNKNRAKEEFENPDKKAQESWGVTFDNTIAIVKEAIEGTSKHEVVHLTLQNIENIPTLKAKGFTREAILTQKAIEMGKSKENWSDKAVEEQLALDFENYMGGKGQPKGIIARFFEYLKKALRDLKDAINKTNGDLIRDYYDTLLFGEAVQEETVRINNSGLIQNYIIGSVIDFNLDQKGTQQFKKKSEDNIDYNAVARLMDMEDRNALLEFSDAVGKGKTPSPESAHITQIILDEANTPNAFGTNVMAMKDVNKILDADRANTKDMFTEEFYKLREPENHPLITRAYEELTDAEKLEDSLGMELISKKARMTELASVVSDIENGLTEIKESSNVTDLIRYQKKDGSISTKGEALLEELGYENLEEAKAELAKYIDQRVKYQKTRKEIGQIRKDITTLRATSKEVREQTRNIQRRLRLNKKRVDDIYKGIKIGIKEGQYNTIKRRQAMRAIEMATQISSTKLKELVGANNIQSMTEENFQNLLNKIIISANETNEKDALRQEIQTIIMAKDLSKYDNFRVSLGYPSFSNMSKAQLESFRDEINKYEFGDVFLSPRELETIHRTRFGDIKTARELLQNLEKAGISTSDLSEQDIDVDAIQFANGTVLSQKSPFFAWLVNNRIASKIETAKSMHSFREELNKLVKASRKSEKRGLLDRAIPTDEKVFGVLDTGEGYDTLTTEQKALHDYLKDHFKQAFLYMQENYGMEGRENYVTHIRRGFLETLKDTGSIGQAFKEMFEAEKLDEGVFNLMNTKTGQVLAFEKFLPYMLRREGDNNPSRNLAKVAMTYTTAIEKKKALDKFVPEAMLAVHAYNAFHGTTPKGLQKNPQFEAYVKQFLNDAKGRHIQAITTQGSKMDTTIRKFTTLVRLKFLGLNAISAMVNIIGDTVALTTLMVSNPKSFATSLYRAVTSPVQSHKIGKTVTALFEEDPMEALSDPATNISDKLASLMMFGFGFTGYLANNFYIRSQLTKQEFQSGIVENARLLELAKQMNKVKSNNFYVGSLFGETAVGKMTTLFGNWTFPMATKMYATLFAKGGLTDSLFVNDAKKFFINKEGAVEWAKRDAKDLASVIFVASIMTMLVKAVSGDDDKNKYAKTLKEKMVREMNTIFSAMFNPLNPNSYAVVASQLNEIYKLGVLLLSQEEYSMNGDGYQAGDKKYVKQLKKVVTPSFIRQFKSTDPADNLSPEESTIYNVVKETERLGFNSPESKALIDQLSKEDRSMYNSLKKKFFGKVKPTFEKDKAIDEKSFINQIGIYAKAIGTDPTTAFTRLLEGEAIRRIDNGTIIIYRPDVGDTQAIKTERGGNSKAMKLDHRIPLQLGGSNSNSNLVLEPTEKWASYTPVENYLGKKLRNKDISKKQAQDAITDFKDGKLTFDQIKEKFDK